LEIDLDRYYDRVVRIAVKGGVDVER